MSDEFDEDSIKLIKEMVRFYSAGKIFFWIVIGLGMIASALWGIINVYRYTKGG